MDSWLSLIPPLLAIVMAILTRQVILSLTVGITAGAFILHGSFFDSFSGTIETIVNVFKDAGSTRNIIFSLLIGAIIQLVEVSGGVRGFVNWISSLNIIKSKRQGGLFAILIGSSLFIESNISILTVGTIFRPIFRKFKISMEKLAYIADSSCAPMKVLVPINAWGALLVTQIQEQDIANPTAVFTSSIPFFIYPIVAMLIVILVVVLSVNIGSMKSFEESAAKGNDLSMEEEKNNDPNEKASFFLLPMITLVASMFMFMLITGNGVLTHGSGSKSVLYSVVLTLLVIFVQYRYSGKMTVESYMKNTYKGMSNLLEIAMILMLAFAINSICKQLGTGTYVAGLLQESIGKEWIPVLLFLVSAFVSFSTGTSWGTFAIMLGIGIPVAQSLDIHLPLVIGAVVSGGIWGDHSSPISDTTVISSLASDCSHIDHVKSQLPYAFLGGMISAVLFIILGFVL